MTAQFLQTEQGEPQITRLQRFTPARIGLGAVGAALPTRANLQFALDHARARDAVHTPLDMRAIVRAFEDRNWPVVVTQSAAADRTQYLRRPDLGRRLSPSGRAALAPAGAGCDVAIIATDGLSATAVATNLLPLLDRLVPVLSARALHLGPTVLLTQGRVAVGDEIGQLVGAKLAIVLVGERPGLSASDSLGCYITWHPKVGTPDSARNCVSNIRAGGMELPLAADAIASVVLEGLKHRATGLELHRRGLADQERAICRTRLHDA